MRDLNPLTLRRTGSAHRIQTYLTPTVAPAGRAYEAYRMGTEAMFGGAARYRWSRFDTDGDDSDRGRRPTPAVLPAITSGHGLSNALGEMDLHAGGSPCSR